MKELEIKILNWANKRGILFKENSKNQLLKSFEEMGELSSALLKNDINKIKDSIGDVLVTLIILSEAQETNIEECLNIAWNEIKNRTGKTINGIFLKEGENL